MGDKVSGESNGEKGHWEEEGKTGSLNVQRHGKINKVVWSHCLIVVFVWT